MDIGTGIAIAGLWLMVGASLLSRSVASGGVLLSIVVAATFTVYLAP